MSPINTKTLSPSLARCQAKGLRLPSSPSSFLGLKSPSLIFYSSEEVEDSSAPQVAQPDPNSYRFFKTVDQSLVHRISREFDILGKPDTEGARRSPLHQPMSMFYPQNHAHWSELSPRRSVVCPPPPPPPNALLTNLDINRLVHPAQSLSSPEDSANLPDPRILILTVSPDASNSYIPVMNSIFSAQKLVSTTHTHPSPQPRLSTQKITIDVCKIFGPDSVFLQQAAYLTGGSYIYLEHREALLQYLIVRSIPSTDVEVSTSNSGHFPDVLFAFALDSQNHHRSHRRQDGLSGRLLLSQTRCRRRICLFRLSFQFSAFNSTTCAPPLISFFPVFCQPVPVCSTCR